MSASVHSASPYVPNYMMKQSLWNMGQQTSALQGLITPQTRLMSWQPHLISQAQRDVQHVYNSLAYNRHVHSGPAYGAYGNYGAGCGTFLRIAVKDPDKKMCILEKKIARLSKCCTQGCFLKSKTNQCRKMREAEAELQTLLAMEGGPTSLATAEDMAYDQLRTGIDTGRDAINMETAKTQKYILVGIVASMGLLGAIALLR